MSARSWRGFVCSRGSGGWRWLSAAASGYSAGALDAFAAVEVPEEHVDQQVNDGRHDNQRAAEAEDRGNVTSPGS